MPIHSPTTLATIAAGIEGKRSFQATSSLRGARVRNIDIVPTGRLTPYQAEVFTQGIKTGIVKFVIWSYLTPIAWWGPVRGATPNMQGTWIYNTGSFSATTTNHQRIVGRFIGMDTRSAMNVLVDL